MSAEPAAAHYKAVVGVAAPHDDRCGRFERGHHGHPMQVALAMKQAGDDQRFRPVRLASAEPAQVVDQEVAAITLVADDDGATITVINHDAGIVERLQAISDPFLVWEPQYGVLFVMTEQGRDVMQSGSITCCDSQQFVPCAPPAD